MRFIESVFEKLKRHPSGLSFLRGGARVLERLDGLTVATRAPSSWRSEVIERKADQHHIDLTASGSSIPPSG